MAGIGFELRKILTEDTFYSYLKSFFSAFVFISGPWVISMINLSLLYFVAGGESLVSFIIITYILAISLILSSPIQSILIRFCSDMEFEERFDIIFPSIIGAVIVCGIISILPAILIYIYSPSFSQEIRILISSFCVVNLIFWPLFSTMSILKNYKKVTLYFFSITFLSFIMIYIFYPILGFQSIILFYNISYTAVSIMLIIMIYQRYPSKNLISFEFLKYAKKIWLGLAGFFYYIALWADKIVFWFFAKESISVGDFFYYNPIYDINYFVSTLFLLPILAIITISIETDIAEKFHKFTKSLLLKKSINEIIKAKENTILSIKDGYGMIIIYHGLLTFVLIFYSKYLFRFLEYSHIFKILTIGNLSLAIYIYQTLLLYYLDSHKNIAKNTFIFFVLNSVISYYSLSSVRFYGIGFTISISMVNILMYYDIDYGVRNLDYLMFLREREKKK
ncbi:MAG: exopolysaccharide Pel transporter PelG [Candidatus Muirbacterium halophilum]|nr:exopolysaccharide Pel transporter PelG [Candidatus Muirbacterium halophilum]MCK9474516.1 exopolysaccharide Pel transporter PelG [Candidatus Muirbacterium halophilum]